MTTPVDRYMPDSRIGATAGLNPETIAKLEVYVYCCIEGNGRSFFDFVLMIGRYDCDGEQRWCQTFSVS
jgi:hypothetical protein